MFKPDTLFIRGREMFSARGNNMLTKTLTVLIFLSFFNACDSVPAVKADKPYDFSSQGFLDDHHFQVIVTAKPDKAAKGLVAQRESALTTARNDIQKKALADLVQYRIEIYAHENNIEQSAEDGQTAAIRNYLTAEFRPLLSYGKVTEEYYEKDNSAVVLFRIEKTNLRQEISAIKIIVKNNSPK